MTDPYQNKREFTRVAVTARTVVRSGDTVISGAPTHALSMKGMSIITDQRLPVGSPCEFTIVLVSGEVEIQAEGAVVSHLADGMAFVFNKIIGLESFEHLRNLVFYNAQDVEQVESEFSSHSGIRKRE